MIFRQRKIQIIHLLFLAFCLLSLICLFSFSKGRISSLSAFDSIPLLMIWNIFLALVAFDAALFHLQLRNPFARGFGALIAFLFYPNSFYMVTDAKHIGDWFPSPMDMDFATMNVQKLSSYFLLMAGIFFGIYLGFETIKAVIQRYFSKPSKIVIFVLMMSLLSSAAIYAGRVSTERINSWDLFYRPFYTLEKLFEVFQPKNFPFLLAMTLFQLFIIGLTHLITRKD